MLQCGGNHIQDMNGRQGDLFPLMTLVQNGTCRTAITHADSTNTCSIQDKGIPPRMSTNGERSAVRLLMIAVSPSLSSPLLPLLNVNVFTLTAASKVAVALNPIDSLVPIIEDTTISELTHPSLHRDLGLT